MQLQKKVKSLFEAKLIRPIVVGINVTEDR